MELTVGLIGCGRFAPMHLDALVRNRHARRVIAADPDEMALQEMYRRYGIIKRVEADWRAVIDAEDVDIIDVLTPHDSHCEIAVAALEAGKHVICEKPIARTLDEADAMIAAAEAAGRRLLISLPQVHFPSVARSRELLAEGTIGRPYLAVFNVYDDEVQRMSDPDHWKGDLERAGGGVLIDAGYHPTYVMLHLFGRPRAVTSMCRRLVIDTEGTGEDTAAVALDLGEGMMGTIAVTFADDAERYRAERRILGTEGVLLMRDMPEDELPLLLMQGEDVLPVPVHNPLHVPPYALEATIDDLIGAIVEDREPIASTQLARDTLATVLAAYESEATGRRVELSWAPAPGGDAEEDMPHGQG
ncbi:MAG: Gfo/Idh/MocA family oxidoreductase [Armatimonadota bacterium]|nr:Gfo/Idh/MocA family oxidoreductase [Armatimonadota bacterium]